MREFFEDFLKSHQKEITFFSLLRVVSISQALFWPYAFAKIINILSQEPENWRRAGFWIFLMVSNKLVENFVRIRSKFRLEKIGAKLKVDLATFFSKKTEIRDQKKTGEAVQAIKRASRDIESLVSFYRRRALNVPVNLIVIPLILARANAIYLLLLLGFGVLYCVIDYFGVKKYRQKMKKYFQAAEVFWGTTYRKTPDVWRGRENGMAFKDEVEKEGKDLYSAQVASDNTDSWRWVALQTLSSATLGLAVLFVLYRIVTQGAPVGDLVLVSAYFQKTQGTLNIVSSAATRLLQTKTSLKRLKEAVKIK